MFSNTEWKLQKVASIDSDINFDEDLLKILYKRGIKTDEQIRKFLDPKLEYLNSPKGLYDIDIAIKRIKDAIDNEEMICIYGDYDVDGITSTSILYLTLKELNVKNVMYYIPNRSEGYGVNKDAILKISKKNVSLVITVDCGITSFEEIEYAKTLGIDFVVTDHHNLYDGKVPNAIAVVNPKRSENSFPFRELAGVGTIYMVIYELLKRINRFDLINKYLDLVCIGTVADVVSLQDDNRILVKHGLKLLEKSNIKALNKVLLALNIKQVDTSDISFKIAPLFNSAGRLEDANIVVKFLTSKKDNEIDYILNMLIENNQKRRDIQDKMQIEASEQIKNKKLYEDIAIITSSAHFHHGVIGIVAAKLVEEYNKPVIVIEEKIEEKIGIGSCRGIDEVDMQKALENCSKYLIKFGGHKKAAGFTLELSKLEQFKKAFNIAIKNQLENKEIKKVINIDAQISVSKISVEYIKLIDMLKPFGMGNPTPIFRTNNLLLKEIRKIGKNGQHFHLDFINNGFLIRNVAWFNASDVEEHLKDNLIYDIVYKLKINEYENNYYTSVIVEDMKPSLENNNIKNKIFFDKSIYETVFPIETYVLLNNFNNNEELKVQIQNEKVYIIQGTKILARLNANLETLILKLKSSYNFDFSAEYKGKNKIYIYRDFGFKSYSTRDNVIFNKIKEKINKHFPYNGVHKIALNNLFKKNKKAILSKDHIEVSNSKFKIEDDFFEKLKLTYAMYYYYKTNKKVQILTDKKISKSLKEFISITNQENIDINEPLIVHLSKSDIEFSSKTLLILDETDRKDVIKSKIVIPKNIKHISEYVKENKNEIFNKYLPDLEKKELLESNKTFFADNTVLEYIMEEK